MRLFDRLGRRVALTDPGRKLVGHAERILDLTEEARADLDGEETEPAGTVTVSATEMQCAYRLPPVLEEFRERFPKVRLVFRPSTPTGALDAETRRAIAEGAVDAAFVLQAPLDGAQHADFLAEPLVEEPLVVVARPDHPLARASEVGRRTWRTRPSCSTRRDAATASSSRTSWRRPGRARRRRRSSF